MAGCRGPRRGAGAALVAMLLLGSAVLAAAPGESRAGYPELTDTEYTAFVTGLSVPVAAPGATINLVATLTDPLPEPIDSVNLSFEFYAFNAYPGNGTGPLPSDGAPSFDTGSTAGRTDWLTLASLAPGAHVGVTLGVVVPSSAPLGDYAIRTGLDFGVNGSAYLLESRGFFSYGTWANATAGPAGSPTLNLTRLGVSGVLPETALAVESTSMPWVLAGLVAGALLLAGAGAYYAVRRGPRSSSGAR